MTADESSGKAAHFTGAEGTLNTDVITCDRSCCKTVALAGVPVLVSKVLPVLGSMVVPEVCPIAWPCATDKAR